jgi:transposase
MNERAMGRGELYPCDPPKVIRQYRNAALNYKLACWRDLPETFGGWNSVFRRFSRWSVKSVWARIFEAMSDDPDFEYRRGSFQR